MNGFMSRYFWGILLHRKENTFNVVILSSQGCENHFQDMQIFLQQIILQTGQSTHFRLNFQPQALRFLFQQSFASSVLEMVCLKQQSLLNSSLKILLVLTQTARFVERQLSNYVSFVLSEFNIARLHWLSQYSPNQCLKASQRMDFKLLVALVLNSQL